MRDGEYAPLFPVLSVCHGVFSGQDINREPPSIFSSVRWYLSQLIQSAHCEMIHWGNSSDGDAETTDNRISGCLRLDDVSGETIP